MSTEFREADQVFNMRILRIVNCNDCYLSTLIIDREGLPEARWRFHRQKESVGSQEQKGFLPCEYAFSCFIFKYFHKGP